MTTTQLETFNNYKISNQAMNSRIYLEFTGLPLTSEFQSNIDKDHELTRQALEIVCQGDKKIDFSNGIMSDFLTVAGFDFNEDYLYFTTQVKKRTCFKRLDLKHQFEELAIA